jgi:hypothetical protein
VVHRGLIGVVWIIRVSSDGGLVVSGYHRVAHPQERGAGALSLTRGQIILIGQFLEDGMPPNPMLKLTAFGWLTQIVEVVSRHLE